MKTHKARLLSLAFLITGTGNLLWGMEQLDSPATNNFSTSNSRSSRNDSVSPVATASSTSDSSRLSPTTSITRLRTSRDSDRKISENNKHIQKFKTRLRKLDYNAFNASKPLKNFIRYEALLVVQGSCRKDSDPMRDGEIRQLTRELIEANNATVINNAEQHTNTAIKNNNILRDKEAAEKRQGWRLLGNVLKGQLVRGATTIFVSKYLDIDKFLHRASGKDIHITIMKKLRAELEENIDDLLINPSSCTPHHIKAFENRSKQIVRFHDSGIADYQTNGTFDTAGNYAATGETPPDWLPHLRSKTAEIIERHALTAIIRVLGLCTVDVATRYIAAPLLNKTATTTPPPSTGASGTPTTEKKPPFVRSSLELIVSYSSLLANDATSLTSALVGNVDKWTEHSTIHQNEMSNIDKKIDTLKRYVRRTAVASSSSAAAA